MTSFSSWASIDPASTIFGSRRIADHSMRCASVTWSGGNFLQALGATGNVNKDRMSGEYKQSTGPTCIGQASKVSGSGFTTNQQTLSSSEFPPSPLRMTGQKFLLVRSHFEKWIFGRLFAPALNAGLFSLPLRQARSQPTPDAVDSAA